MISRTTISSIRVKPSVSPRGPPAGFAEAMLPSVAACSVCASPSPPPGSVLAQPNDAPPTGRRPARAGAPPRAQPIPHRGHFQELRESHPNTTDGTRIAPGGRRTDGRGRGGRRPPGPAPAGAPPARRRATPGAQREALGRRIRRPPRGRRTRAGRRRPRPSWPGPAPAPPRAPGRFTGRGPLPGFSNMTSMTRRLRVLLLLHVQAVVRTRPDPACSVRCISSSNAWSSPSLPARKRVVIICAHTAVPSSWVSHRTPIRRFSHGVPADQADGRLSSRLTASRTRLPDWLAQVHGVLDVRQRRESPGPR